MTPMNDQQKMSVTKDEDETDVNKEMVQLFEEIGGTVYSIKGSLSSLKNDFEKKQISTEKGMSLLEVKNQMLLSYITNLTYLVMKKCSGHCIQGDKAIEHLVEIRTVLERIRPIENKLKYQIDKLLKIASTRQSSANDPTSFRANPDNMISDNFGVAVEDVSDDDEEDKKKGNNSKNRDGQHLAMIESKKKAGIYVPPKLVAVHYDGDKNDSVSKKEERLLERARKHALNSSVLQELGEEYLDTPTEIAHSTSSSFKQSKNESKFSRNKQQYEETYFTRLPITKKDKHLSRRNMMTVGTLGGITNFEDISVLDPSSHYTPSNKKRKRNSKHGSSSKKKGFKSKKRKFH